MFFNKEFLGFFGSVTETKKQKRDIPSTFMADVADTGIETLPITGIGDEPGVYQIQQGPELVKDVPVYDATAHFQSNISQTVHSMTMLKHPLGEVFGFTTTDQSPKAQRYRSHRHCPFNNKVPNCTNDQSKNPLGVCSVLYDNKPVITCPVRFREDWMITDDAAAFFFEEGVRWSSLTEVHLNDAAGTTAGNIDIMLVAYDERGKMIDFGALEVHAADITGNLREPFEYYMQDTSSNFLMDWTAQPSYPQPDFLSAARNSLVPQLLFKGRILHSWNKKMAIAINQSLFETLPSLNRVKKEDADIAWLIYDFEVINDGGKERYQLKKTDVVYTQFKPTLSALTAIAPGNVGDFVRFIPELAG